MKIIAKTMKEVLWLMNRDGHAIRRDDEHGKLLRQTKSAWHYFVKIPMFLCSRYRYDLLLNDEAYPDPAKLRRIFDRTEERYKPIFHFNILREDAKGMLFYWIAILHLKLNGIRYQEKLTRTKAPEPYKRFLDENDDDLRNFIESKTIDVRAGVSEAEVRSFINYFMGFHFDMEESSISEDLDPYLISTGYYRRKQRVTAEAPKSPASADREFGLWMSVEELANAMGLEPEHDRVFYAKVYGANSVRTFSDAWIELLRTNGLLKGCATTVHVSIDASWASPEKEGSPL